MSLLSRPTLWLAALAALAIASCKPPPESVKVTEIVDGPPDLVKLLAANPANRAFQLRAFHLNHIWAGTEGQPDPAGNYRAKITVWDYSDDPSAVAELYFHDGGPQPLPASASPINTKRPYQLHFPISTIGPMLNTLRNTNEPIFVYYFNGRWAVGNYVAEPVGVD